MISYPNYKFIFPIKALGMFARRFDNSKVENYNYMKESSET
jgi:lanosterol synthase